VDIDPAVTGRAQLDPRRHLVRLAAYPSPPERRQAATQIRCVHGNVQVMVPAGLPARQRGHSPSAAHPGPDPALVQRIQDPDNVRRIHAAHASVHGQHGPPRLAVHTAGADRARVTGSHS